MQVEKLTISSNDKLSLLSNLGTLFTAGIPILEAVDSLAEDSKGNTRKILDVIHNDLIQGQHLYASFSKFPNVFDKVTVNILRASEEAGTLDVTLKDLQEQIQKEIEFNDKIKGAMTYPIIIFIVFLLVLLMILTVVMPKIATVFLQLKVPLPLPTLILIFASKFILTYTIQFILGIVAVAFGFYFLYRAKKQFILGLLFKLPLISNLVKEVDLTRFSRSMHLLLTSGLTITTALDLSQEVVMRADIAKGIAYAKDMVLAGKDLSSGFKESKKVFSSIMIKIIEAGEKTGTLDKSLQEISEHLDYQVTKTLKTVSVTLEPIMLVFVGILVGAMMLSIIGPIYGLIGQIGTK